MDLDYIKEVSSWDSGGGIKVDLVTLTDGRVLAITDEVIVLYRNLEDLIGNEPRERPMIAL
mgnify:CR=1 FL=1